MNKPIEQFSDTELLAVIRLAENTNVPGSQYQKANSEYQMRHQQKILDAIGQNRGGVFFEVGGDMTNHGVIQDANEAIVNVAVAGNYSSNKKAKIILGEVKSGEKSWYEKPFGIFVISAASGVVAAVVVFYLNLQ